MTLATINAEHGSFGILENDSTSQPHLEMSQYVIYQHPRDYPGDFVMRRWHLRGQHMMATEEMVLARTLSEIRKAVPAGLYCITRFEDDDPCIVEVWL